MSFLTNKPVVVILGSGAIGCYYGARLVQTRQYHVFFYMRSSSYSCCKEHGLKITSIHGDIEIASHDLNVFDSVQTMIHAIYELQQVSSPQTRSSDVHVDWILLGFKSTIFQQENDLYKIIQPFISLETRILAIMNGFVDSALVSCIEQQTYPDPVLHHPFLFSLKQCAAVYAGMAFICCNRIHPGHVHHTFAGKLTTSLSAIRCSNESEIPLQELINKHKDAVESLWSNTRPYFESVYIDNLIQARWTKNLWNLPFNGISVAMGGITTDLIVKDPGLRLLALKIMEETVTIANQDLLSRGYRSETFLGESETQLMLQLTDVMGPYKTSTMLDLVHRRPMEVKYLFRIALDTAAKLNVSCPHLETIVLQIESHQRMHQLY